MPDQSSTKPDPKMLSQEALREFFDNPYVYRHTHGESDEYTITVDSERRVIMLETPNDGTARNSGRLKSIIVDEADDGAGQRLTIEVGDMPEASYSLAFSVYKSMEEGATFAAALDTAIESFRAVIAKRPKMSAEQVAGLYGELIVLDRLISEAGPENALEMWMGPDAEEHDFGLPGFDLEVKTTLSEKRAHVISGADQLKPREGVELWLLSIQLTRVGGGAGVSLDDKCMEMIEKFGPLHRALREGLRKAGWTVDDYGLYLEKFDLRNKPRAFLVTEDFPAITSARLAESVPGHDKLSDIRYRVDVSALRYGRPDTALEDFVEEPN